ncbi:MAG: hypothetical protein HQM09_22190 [Candidatus Riflebacteria bacterium]|nr:hypothetical protein [Candidatus Riflebacteria bacterium]
MKTLILTFRPLSPFGTPLKGDTIFGHLCWQIAQAPELFGATLDQLLADYDKNPFLVVSSAIMNLGSSAAPSLVLKRPSLPFHRFSGLQSSPRTLLEKRKELKARSWVIASRAVPFLSPEQATYLNGREVLEKFTGDYPQELRKRVRTDSLRLTIGAGHWRNSINLTGCTGEGGFAPYHSEEVFYLPKIKLSCIIGCDDRVPVEALTTAFERIGTCGFGRDASTGLGKFELIDQHEIDLKAFGASDASAGYTLAPAVPGLEDGQPWFTPFVRYGRHGDVLAISSHPFKNPCLLADDGAVFPLKDNVGSRTYVGKALRGLSKVESRTVSQGYSLFIPVRMEEIHA